MMYTYAPSSLSPNGGSGKWDKDTSPNETTRSKHFNVQNLGKCYQTRSASNGKSMPCSSARWALLSALLSTVLGVKRKRSRVGDEFQAPAGPAPLDPSESHPKRGRGEVCTENFEQQMDPGIFRPREATREIAFAKLTWIYTQWMQSEHEFRIYKREFDEHGKIRWKNTQTLTVVKLIVPQTHNAMFQVICEPSGGLRSSKQSTYSLVYPYIDNWMLGVMEMVTEETTDMVFYGMSYTPKLGKSGKSEHQRTKRISRAQKMQHERAVREICKATVCNYVCLPMVDSTVELARRESPFTIAPLPWCRANRKSMSSVSKSSASVLEDVTNSSEVAPDETSKAVRALADRLPPAEPKACAESPMKAKSPTPRKLSVRTYDIYKIQDIRSKTDWYPCIVLGTEADNQDDQIIYQGDWFWVRFFPREKRNGTWLNFDQQYHRQLSSNTWAEWGCDSQTVQKLESLPNCPHCGQDMKLAMAAREDGYIDDEFAAHRDVCSCKNENGNCEIKEATRENHLAMKCGYYYQCMCGKFYDPRCLDHSGLKEYKNLRWD